MAKFKEGYKVHCESIMANGIISLIHKNDDKYPIQVQFNNTSENPIGFIKNYTIDGIMYGSTKPSLTIIEPKPFNPYTDGLQSKPISPIDGYVNSNNIPDDNLIISSSGMKRENKDDKVQFDLMYPRGIKFKDSFLYGFAKNLTKGAKIHGYRNWEQANISNLQDFRDGLRRHMEQYLQGEIDEDHHNRIMFNLLGMRTIQIKYECDVFGNKTINKIKE